MKEMKRLLALVLCFVMLVGLMPVSALAAETEQPLDTAIMFSDLHTSNSDYKESTLKGVMNGIKNAGLPVSSVTSCGDAFSVNEDSGKYTGYTSTLTGYIQSVLPGVPVNYVWSDHDRYAVGANDKTLLDNDSGFIYGAGADGKYGTSDDGNYYIYELSMADLSTNNRYNADFHSNSEVTATISQFKTDAAKLDQTKPLLIASHQPLLDRRNDNGHAYEWATAINEVAENMDVAFFFGHNHKYDQSSDYYYAKGSQMSVEGMTNKLTLNFTHACAGYLEPTSTGSYSQSGTRRNVVMAVSIYDDSIQLTTYDKNGVYTGSYKVNETITRDHASEEAPEEPVTLESIALSGKTEYTVGDENLGLVVTATYSNGDTEDVTLASVLTGYDLSVAGKQTVTATYEGKTATCEITVVLPTLTEWDDTGLVSVQATALGLSKLTVTNAYETYPEVAALFSNYMAVDVALEGVAAGTSVDYVLQVVEDMPTDGLVLYHVDGQTKTPINYTLTTSQSGGSYLNFTSAATTGTFAYGQPAILEDYVLSSIAITGVKKTNYYVGESLDMVSPTVTATYTKEGAEDIYRVLEIMNDNGVTDGYTVSGYDMTVVGSQTVTVSYENCTTSFDIRVWQKDFTDENTGVALDLSQATHGVTGLVVDEVTDAFVMDAVAEVMTGNIKAYDIKPTNFAGGTASVTLPLPEGVANPVVYHVSGAGRTEKMTITAQGEDTVTFTTTHFSTYVVGESTEITVPNPETATGSGSTTTTTEKDVYVRVSAPTAGNQYIIVNRNTAGSGYALKENTTTGSSITVKAAGDGISAPYIETTDKALMWNATTGLKLQSENGSYYLRYNRGLAFDKANSTNWTYANNRLSYKSGRDTYYLRYNSGWSASTTQSNVYFYEKQTIEVESTTTVSGTYSIVGNPAEVKQVVKADGTSTLALGATLTFQPENGAATTSDVSTTATYTLVEGGDPNRVISGFNGNTVTFSGKTGKALIKVSYDTNGNAEGGVVTNYISIDATEPYYALDLHKIDNGNLGEEVDSTIAIKGIKKDDTYNLWAVIMEYDGVIEDGEDGKDIGDVEDALIRWESSDETVATVDPATGIITFTGKDGTVRITATYQAGNHPSDTVTLSVTQSLYNVPADGTDDFPEYPNEGAIRFDKTATAVGNFSETGIAKVELSMTGVPYTTEKGMDVVLMLDRSSSMYKSGVQHRIDDTITATKAFVNTIVKNEDGSFNNNRILIMDFLGGNLDSSQGGGSSHKYQSNTYTLNDSNGYEIISNQTELAALFDRIDKGFVGQTSLYGTEYAQGLEDCYNALAASKADGNQQFCVFMSDGIPNYMMGETTHFKTTNAIAATFDVTNRTAANGTAKRNATKYEYEYYSTQMKNQGVTVYTVGLGLKNTNSAWSGTSKEVCEQVANMLLNDIAGPAGETAAQRDTGNAVSKLNKYFFSVADANAAEDMENVFTTIAGAIMQAATDVTVEDKITDEYTMIFDIPTGTEDITGVTNDFYIEFLKYTLDATTHERTGASTSVTKLYLKNTNGTLSAAKDSAGTAYDAPVFEQKFIGDKGTLMYWTTDATKAGEAALSITNNGNTYYFMPYGLKVAKDAAIPAGWYNMTSGGYASGSVGEGNMSTNVVIATPYFVYNAADKMIYWTLDKLQDATTEYALQYFLYLDDSATEVGTPNEIDPGSYLTNEYAFLSYTNYKGKDCRDEFPKPQLTWSGAQVSYVFYLVNAAGQPINKSGQVVDFANATFITNPYTEKTVWNKDSDGHITADSKLSVDWLAHELLPDDYKIYDEQASYKLHVYGDHTGESIFDYFTIAGGDADAIKTSLSARLDKNINNVSQETTKVYNTKAGTKYSEYGTYASEEADGVDEVLTNFDFYNTTVAFAVVWQPSLAPDTIVVDYGLDVLINVLENDLMQGSKLSGIGKDQKVFGNLSINSGVSTYPVLKKDPVTLNSGDKISIESDRQIRFQQSDMQFKDPVTFYYETTARYFEDSQERNGYMYSSVTVIPATTVYYEDAFLSYSATNTAWETEGTAVNTTQAQDRPGRTDIIGVVDANNNYGYDAAYNNMSQFSLGAAKKVHVDVDSFATASFSFYGTGFDVIGLTSNTTGVLWVKVNAAQDIVVNGETKYASGDQVKSTVVNTYYGYVKNGDDWVLTNNVANSLYQVPVMQIEELPYGKYDVTITASYVPSLDKTTGVEVDDKGMFVSSDGYYLYLDAIRIYNPTGNMNDVANNAYAADGEAWPTYVELRNNVISAEGVTTEIDDEGNITVVFPEEDTFVKGAIFIDGDDECNSIADYVSYGPNNELYLAEGQSVAFQLDQTYASIIADVQIGLKSADGNAVTYKIYDANTTAVANAKANTLTTTTDMYYSIKDLASGNIVITNTGESGILSITNIKTTYTEAPSSGVAEANLLMDEEGAGIVLMSLRPAPVIEEEVPETNVPETTVPEVTEPEVEETTEPETQETKPSKPTKPGKEDKETKPTKPGKEDKETKPTKPGKEDKATKPTEPANNNKPAMNDRAEEVRNNLDKVAAAIRNVVTALLSRWF